MTDELAHEHRGNPLFYRSWTAWSYAQVDAGLLTGCEVTERLALEWWILRCYGADVARPF